MNMSCEFIYNPYEAKTPTLFMTMGSTDHRSPGSIEQILKWAEVSRGHHQNFWGKLGEPGKM